jgi:FdhE protein
MMKSLSPSQAYERIDTSIRRLSERTPALSNVYEAFGELIAQQAVVKAELPEGSVTALAVHMTKYAQGIPVLGEEAFAVASAGLRKAAERILPAMEKGFPSIRGQLFTLKRALKERDPANDQLALSLTSGSEHAMLSVADTLKIDSSVITFVVGQLKKPFAEKLAEAVPPLLKGAPWYKGYCPICGSWPELSYLEGTEGRRWLRCSFCGHEWTFARTQCPFCETQDLGKIELIFQEDRKSERAELCHECGKYIVSVDLRELVEVLPHEVAALGLVYLDMLAQQRGFRPGAVCAWNVIGDTSAP